MEIDPPSIVQIVHVTSPSERLLGGSSDQVNYSAGEPTELTSMHSIFTGSPCRSRLLHAAAPVVDVSQIIGPLRVAALLGKAYRF